MSMWAKTFHGCSEGRLGHLCSRVIDLSCWSWHGSALRFPGLETSVPRRRPAPPLEAATSQADSDERLGCPLAKDVGEVTGHASQRRARARGDVDVRCPFESSLPDSGNRSVRVYGTFNPARVTSSTANAEFRGTRVQYVLARVAQHAASEVEMRPFAIATRLLGAAAG
jgi:hypothetical protein